MPQGCEMGRLAQLESFAGPYYEASGFGGILFAIAVAVGAGLRAGGGLRTLRIALS